MANIIAEPEWAADLVIYEIATTNFTSPNGPESGTFAALSDRLDYLQRLGVSGIWLTGHNLADDRHFYNIWTQYATIRPDRIDPRLGTESEFRSLIDAAHLRGIRLFLDVITHGVMPGSALVTEHPEWFSGGSWGMVDYDWFGDHPDLDAWWVETWVRYVRDFGVDGFRLDVSMYRPDLWEEIRRRSWEIGHPIVIFHENGPEKAGVVDFLQKDIRLKDTKRTLSPRDPAPMSIVSTVVSRIANGRPEYRAEAWKPDAAQPPESPESRVEAQIVEILERRELVHNRRTGGDFYDDIITLSLDGVPKSFGNISVKDRDGWEWRLSGMVDVDYTARLLSKPADRKTTLELSNRYCAGSLINIQLSCHDDGWDGHPLDVSPYVARGSRFLFGWVAILQPAIPVFMSGEEFDADYVPVPRLSPRLYGGEDPGLGRWLYGSWMHWEQLEEPRHQAMLRDASAVISIRKSYSSLIRSFRKGEANSRYFELREWSDDRTPAPYAYCDSNRLLIVAGNPSESADATGRLSIPWAALPIEKRERYRLRDVWNATDAVEMTKKELAENDWRIRRDKTPRGGLAVWEIST